MRRAPTHSGISGMNMKKAKSRTAALAMMCHLVAFTGLVFPLANIAAPFLIWIVWRKKSELIEHHGRESMNFQITFTIGWLLLVILSFALAFDDVILYAGWVIGLFGLIFYFMQIINAATSAGRGDYSTYPYTIRLIKGGARN